MFGFDPDQTPGTRGLDPAVEIDYSDTGRSGIRGEGVSTPLGGHQDTGGGQESGGGGGSSGGIGLSLSGTGAALARALGIGVGYAAWENRDLPSPWRAWKRSYNRLQAALPRGTFNSIMARARNRTKQWADSQAAKRRPVTNGDVWAAGNRIWQELEREYLPKSFAVATLSNRPPNPPKFAGFYVNHNARAEAIRRATDAVNRARDATERRRMEDIHYFVSRTPVTGNISKGFPTRALKIHVVGIISGLVNRMRDGVARNTARIVLTSVQAIPVR